MNKRADSKRCTGVDVARGISAKLGKQHAATGAALYLGVRGRYVPASVHPDQRVVREGQVELDVGRMVHVHVKPPKESRRDGLALLGADVHLAAVDGPASHPFLCAGRNKTRQEKNTLC